MASQAGDGHSSGFSVVTVTISQMNSSLHALLPKRLLFVSR